MKFNWVYKTGEITNYEFPYKGKNIVNISLDEHGIKIIQKGEILPLIRFDEIREINTKTRENWNFLIIVDVKGIIHNISFKIGVFYSYTDMKISKTKIYDLKKDITNLAIQHQVEKIIVDTQIHNNIRKISSELSKIKRPITTTGFYSNFKFSGKNNQITHEPLFFDEFLEKILSLLDGSYDYGEFPESFFNIPPSIIILNEKDNKPYFNLFYNLTDKLNLKMDYEDAPIKYLDLLYPFIFGVIWLKRDLEKHEGTKWIKDLISEYEIVSQSSNSFKIKLSSALIERINEEFLKEVKILKEKRPAEDEIIILSYEEKVKKDKLKRLEEVPAKFKKLIEVSNKVKLEMLQDVLEMDSKIFNKMIFEWAIEFGFRIDGDYILFENVDISGFIAKLDEQFKMWENKEKSKQGKLN